MVWIWESERIKCQKMTPRLTQILREERFRGIIGNSVWDMVNPGKDHKGICAGKRALSLKADDFS